MSNKIAIAYIPVLHKGYDNFLDLIKQKDCYTIYLIGDDILHSHEEMDYINRKDRLRAIETGKIAQFIETLNFKVKELTHEVITELQDENVSVLTPNEDIGRVVVDAYFSEKDVEYIDIFLRWNKENVGENKKPDAKCMSLSVFQSKVCKDMLTEAAKSFDWWRQVGAVLIKDKEVVYVTHNEHMPEAQQPNIDGDTRALFKKGININYVTSAHAEVAAIGAAAKNGIKTEGTELFVTDFPCPYCARLIVKAGIKKVYFMKGYAVLDGDEFLKEEGIEVVKVSV